MRECKFSGSLEVECFMSAFEARYNPDFDFIGEYHDFWEAVYIISSKAGVSADDKIYSLSQNDIIFHKPMEFHRIWAIEGLPVNAFIFSFKLSGVLAEKLKNKVFHLSQAQGEAVMTLMREMREIEIQNSLTGPKAEDDKLNFLEHWNNSEPINTVIKCRTELLLLDIIKSELSPKEQYISRSADIYRQIIRIMKENLQKNLSVGDIARRCNFSEAYIKKIFSEFSDCGIHNYFIKLKIKEAVTLLETGLSVGEVSERLSFSNANYFAVCFKREMGCSPIRYIRKRQ